MAPAEDDPFILQSGRALYWSYLKACAASFAATMGFMTLFRSGLDLMPSFFDFNFLAAFAIAPAIAAMMMQPSIHVWRYVAGFGLRRGISDMVTGGLVGSIWVLLPLLAGQLPTPFSVCFMLGGIVGGFAFWRAQGYPGISSGAAAAFDAAYVKTR